MSIVNEATTSGIPMASANRWLKLGCDYYHGDKLYTVQKAVALVDRASCHSGKGVQCVMCDVCKSWMISARVVCLVCRHANPPQTSRLFKCSLSKGCKAANSVYENYTLEVNDGGLVMVCKHKKTGCGKSFQYFGPSEHIGNLFKMHQFFMLCNSTREEILNTLRECKQHGVLSYLTSLNALSCFRSFGEKQIAAKIEESLSEAITPESIRNCLSFVVASMKDDRVKALKPAPSEGSIIVIISSGRRTEEIL